jgi:hypothetical protein
MLHVLISDTLPILLAYWVYVSYYIAVILLQNVSICHSTKMFDINTKEN